MPFAFSINTATVIAPLMMISRVSMHAVKSNILHITIMICILYNGKCVTFIKNHKTVYLPLSPPFSGTASVAVAGILAALKITKNKLSDHKFVFQGAGEVMCLQLRDATKYY